MPLNRSFWQYLKGFWTKTLPPPSTMEGLDKILALPVSHVMTPRSAIVAADDKIALEDLYRMFLETRYVALPIFHKDLDQMLGFITLHDLMAAQFQPERHWSSDMKPIFFIPPSTSIPTALSLLQKTRDPFLLVVDEYGGVDGLVKFHQLSAPFMEFLSGESVDLEHLDIQPAKKRADGAWLLDGRFQLRHFEKLSHGVLSPFIKFDQFPDVGTIGGLVCTLVGRVPLKGEVIHHDSGLIFEILEANPRRIKHLALCIPETVHQDAVAQ